MNDEGGKRQPADPGDEPAQRQVALPPDAPSTAANDGNRGERKRRPMGNKAGRVLLPRFECVRHLCPTAALRYGECQGKSATAFTGSICAQRSRRRIVIAMLRWHCCRNRASLRAGQ